MASIDSRLSEVYGVSCSPQPVGGWELAEVHGFSSSGQVAWQGRYDRGTLSMYPRHIIVHIIVMDTCHMGTGYALESCLG